MESPSIADIKERLNKLNIAPYPRSPATSISNNESPSLLAPRIPERSKSVSSNSSSINTNQATTDSNASSLSTSVETSSTRDAILARYRQQGGNKNSGYRKPPVPLPQTDSQSQNDISSARDKLAAHFRQQGSNNTTTTSKKPPVPLPRSGGQSRKGSISSVLQDTATSNRVLALDVNATTDLRKSPVPLPSTDYIENTYAELSNDLPDSTSSLSPTANENFYEGFNRPSVSLPISTITNQHNTVHSDPLSASLDTMLPSKSMFFEFETIINDYQRKDPRTIIYPKIKPTMPKMTIDEINTLQRYSNT